MCLDVASSSLFVQETGTRKLNSELDGCLTNKHAYSCLYTHSLYILY